MPRGCDHATHVRVEDRYFIVEFDADGEVLRIKERKQKQLPMVGVYDVSYWKAGTHVLGTGNTMPKRIIAAAREKIAGEDAAHNATP